MRFSTTITNANIIGEPLGDILDKVAATGFDAVDFPGEPDIYPLANSKDILASYAKKLPVAEVTACINPARSLMSPDEKARRKAIDYVKYCIDAASGLGVELTHACFITTAEILQNTAPPALERAALASLKVLADYAKDAGVRLMLEPLFSGDNTIVKTTSAAVALFSKSLGMDVEAFMHGQRDFGLLLDLFHMHNEEVDMFKAIRDHASITMHVHVADHARSLDFTRDDSAFVRTAVAALRDKAYAGCISFESFHPSISFEVLGAALKVIKTF
ncbi:MAG: sugar phosphate isomerase/epimerase [Candidatus Lokiarchaeota archaeon]|nr:sugar phosphate isomerase/epimerase [Candidatus Lokiarchaeota archaeon]